MNWENIPSAIVKVIYDCLEECMETMTLASGKRLRHVFYVALSFLPISLVLSSFKFPLFIQWQEAMIAIVFLGILCSLEYLSKKEIKNIKNKLSGVIQYGSKQFSADRFGITGKSNTSSKSRHTRAAKCSKPKHDKSDVKSSTKTN